MQRQDNKETKTQEHLERLKGARMSNLRIVSQDENMDVLYDDVSIKLSECESSILVLDRVFNDGYEIGKYASAERCKEIMNDIRVTNIINNSLPTPYFYMPKE